MVPSPYSLVVPQQLVQLLIGEAKREVEIARQALDDVASLQCQYQAKYPGEKPKKLNLRVRNLMAVAWALFFFFFHTAAALLPNFFLCADGAE